MAHDDVELRILGALSEKERLTPDLAPLSTGALVAACNQRTARDPVMDVTERQVEDALTNLRAKGLVATIQTVRDRVPKHRQRLVEALDLSPDEAAIVTVLLLRGPQTPGELRSRCERYGGLDDVDAVTRTLDRLTTTSPAVVRDLGRAPGQSQRRFVHTLGVDAERSKPRARAAPSPSDVGDDVASLRAAIEACLARHTALEMRIDALEAEVRALRG